MYKIVLFAIIGINQIFAGSGFYYFAEKEPPTVAITIVEKAKYAMAEIEIDNSRDDAVERLNEIRQTMLNLVNTIDKSEDFTIVPGPVSLSLIQNAKFSVGLFGSNSNVSVKVLVDLSKHNNDFINASIELRKLINGVTAVGKTKVRIRPVTIAVENPAKYRSKLIDMIYSDIEMLRSKLGQSIAFELTGLENEVKVHQYDDKHVQIFINYTLSVKYK